MSPALLLSSCQVGLSSSLPEDAKLQTLSKRIVRMRGMIDLLQKSFSSYAESMLQMSKASTHLCRDVRAFYNKSSVRQSSVSKFVDCHYEIDELTTATFKTEFGWDITKVLDEWNAQMDELQGHIHTVDETRAEVATLSARVKTLKSQSARSEADMTAYTRGEKQFAALVRRYHSMVRTTEQDIQNVVEGRFNTFDKAFANLMVAQMRFFGQCAATTDRMAPIVQKFQESLHAREAHVSDDARDLPRKISRVEFDDSIPLDESDIIEDLPQRNGSLQHESVDEEPVVSLQPAVIVDKPKPRSQKPSSSSLSSSSNTKRPNADSKAAAASSQGQNVLNLFGDFGVSADSQRPATAPPSNDDVPGAHRAPQRIADEPSSAAPVSSPAPKVVDLFSMHIDVASDPQQVSSQPTSMRHSNKPNQQESFDIFDNGDAAHEHDADDMFSLFKSDVKQTSAAASPTNNLGVSEFDAFDPMGSHRSSPTAQSPGPDSPHNGILSDDAHLQEFDDMLGNKKKAKANVRRVKSPEELARDEADYRANGKPGQTKYEYLLERNQNKLLEEKRRREQEAADIASAKSDVLDRLEDRLNAWEMKNGQQRPLPTLLSSLHSILWPNSGWSPVTLADVMDKKGCKAAYRAAVKLLHPDQNSNASAEVQAIAERVFNALNSAFRLYRRQRH
jgi:hypothetical protein